MNFWPNQVLMGLVLLKTSYHSVTQSRMWFIPKQETSQLHTSVKESLGQIQHNCRQPHRAYFPWNVPFAFIWLMSVMKSASTFWIHIRLQCYGCLRVSYMGMKMLTWIHFFKTKKNFYFVLGYNWLTVLWWFQLAVGDSAIHKHVSSLGLYISYSMLVTSPTWWLKKKTGD